MEQESLDQLADCNIAVMLVPLALALLVAADLQLWGNKRPVLFPASCIALFIQRATVSLEAPLCGLIVAKIMLYQKILTVLYLNTALMRILSIISDSEEML